MSLFDDESATFVVVVNGEEQYALWPAATAVPTGWRSSGFEGRREACLAYVTTVWTDMRPASLRRASSATD